MRQISKLSLKSRFVKILYKKLDKVRKFLYNINRDREREKERKVEMGFFAVILLGLLIWFSETDLGKFMSYIGAVIIGLAIIISLIQFIF